MYPVLSTMKDDNRRFASAYLMICRSIALVSFPLMTGVFILAEPFVFILWRSGGLYCADQNLAPIGLIQSIETTVGDIYQAKGRTDWMFRWGIGASTWCWRHSYLDYPGA